MDSELLTIAQAAALLTVSYNTVRGLIRCGKLRSYQLGPRGGCFRIHPDDLVAYRESCAVEPGTVQQKSTKRRAIGARFEKMNGERLLRSWRNAGFATDAAFKNEV